MSVVFKYRMFVQVRTDLTDEEIARHVATATARSGAKCLPWRDTGEIIHARRRRVAKEFYRALKQIPPLIKLRADRVDDPELHRNDAIAMRAWRGFNCLCGTIGGVTDDVKHFALVDDGSTACGLEFTTHWPVNGKPECDKCLAVAVEKHPEMKQYL